MLCIVLRRASCPTHTVPRAENKDMVKQLKLEMQAMQEAMAREREEEVGGQDLHFAFSGVGQFCSYT